MAEAFSGAEIHTTVGKVNGTTIDYNDFMKKVDQQEKTMEARGYGSGSALQQQAVEAVWSDEINQIIQNKELEKVGISRWQKRNGRCVIRPQCSRGSEEDSRIYRFNNRDIQWPGWQNSRLTQR